MYQIEDHASPCDDFDVKIRTAHEDPAFADLMAERAAADLAIDGDGEEWRAMYETTDLGSFAA